MATVLGGEAQTFALHFDANANAQLAGVLAANISAGIVDNSIIPSNDSTPKLAHGEIGEFVDTKTPVSYLPKGYDGVVNVNSDATIFGSGGRGESVLSGASDLTFVARGGSGTVVAGAGLPSTKSDDDQYDHGRHGGVGGNTLGGGNTIIVPRSDNGNWLIETGGGNDSIFARGGGNDTIGAGPGHNLIRLGSGHDLVQSSGNDTIFADGGAETVEASKGTKDLIFGGSSQLTYIGGSGTATIIGGTGKGDEPYGGSDDRNSIVTGSSNMTLFGGGDGDQMFGGSGHDTFAPAHGASTMSAGPGSNTFVFSSASAGGSDLIANFQHGMDQIDLQGYGSKAAADAIQSQTHPTGSSTMLSLADGTKITLTDTTNIKMSDFKPG